MADFLSHLIEQSSGRFVGIHPLIPPLFAPAASLPRQTISRSYLSMLPATISPDLSGEEAAFSSKLPEGFALSTDLVPEHLRQIPLPPSLVRDLLSVQGTVRPDNDELAQDTIYEESERKASLLHWHDAGTSEGEHIDLSPDQHRGGALRSPSPTSYFAHSSRQPLPLPGDPVGDEGRANAGPYSGDQRSDNSVDDHVRDLPGPHKENVYTSDPIPDSDVTRHQNAIHRVTEREAVPTPGQPLSPPGASTPDGGRDLSGPQQGSHSDQRQDVTSGRDDLMMFKEPSRPFSSGADLSNAAPTVGPSAKSTGEKIPPSVPSRLISTRFVPSLHSPQNLADAPAIHLESFIQTSGGAASSSVAPIDETAPPGYSSTESPSESGKSHRDLSGSTATPTPRQPLLLPGDSIGDSGDDQSGPYMEKSQSSDSTPDRGHDTSDPYMGKRYSGDPARGGSVTRGRELIDGVREYNRITAHHQISPARADEYDVAVTPLLSARQQHPIVPLIEDTENEKEDKQGSATQQPVAAEPSASIIRVRIGRVEVRAASPESASTSKTTRASRLGMTLSEYMQQRKEHLQ